MKKSGAKAPSKSWIYNAVNLAIDCEDYKSIKHYEKLLLSHKILLFPISDRRIKEYLIKEIALGSYTVSQLKDRIAEIKDSDLPIFEEKIIKQIKDKKSKSQPKIIKKRLRKSISQEKSICNIADESEALLKIVKSPEALFHIDNEKNLKFKSLSGLKDSNLNEIKTLALQKTNEIHLEIDILKSMINTQYELLTKYNGFIKNLDGILTKK